MPSKNISHVAEPGHSLFVIILPRFWVQQTFVSGIGQRYMDYEDE